MIGNTDFRNNHHKNIRYNGTYQFNGTTLPLVNPNEIINSKSLGVFYANNRLAKLSNYTVSNTYNPVEDFYYQFLIEVSNNFIIPSNTNCKIESVTEITFKEGFEAKAGSIFVAKIDTQTNKSFFPKHENQITQNTISFDSIDVIENVVFNELDIEDPDNLILNYFPNPFFDRITINLKKEIQSGRILIFNALGIAVTEEIINISNYIDIIEIKIAFRHLLYSVA